MRGTEATFKLTPREEEVKRLLDQRMPPRAIAAALEIGEHRVHEITQHIRQKRDAARRREWEKQR